MNREGKLLKNTVILTIGSIFTKLITFFLLPLYTKILSTEEYGLVDLLNTLVSLLLPLITFQIEQGVFRKLIELRCEKDELKKNKYISTGFYTILINCFFAFMIFGTFQFIISSEYKLYLIINLVAFIFASYFQQVVRGNDDNKSYAISSVISAFFTVVFNLIFLVHIKLGAKGMLLGTFLGQLSCIIYLLISKKLYKKISTKNYSKKLKKDLLGYSMPLIPNAISWWIFNASDRIIVNLYLGLSSVGILAASHKFSAIYITVYNIFHLGWLESVSEHSNDKDLNDYFNKMFNIMFFLFTSLSLSIIAIMPILYPLLIDDKFVSGYNLVPISMLGSIFNIVIALDTAIYVAKKNTKAIANTAIVSAIINIITHLILINFIGLYASTISTAIAYLVLAIYRHLDICKNYFKVKFNKRKFVFSILISIIIFILYYINIWYINIIMIILVIIFDFLINRKYLRSFLKFIKSKKHNNLS